MDTVCWSCTPKRHRQLRVKNLPKVPTWWIERDSNPLPYERKTLVESTNEPPRLTLMMMMMTLGDTDDSDNGNDDNSVEYSNDDDSVVWFVHKVCTRRFE